MQKFGELPHQMGMKMSWKWKKKKWIELFFRSGFNRYGSLPVYQVQWLYGNNPQLVLCFFCFFHKDTEKKTVSYIKRILGSKWENVASVCLTATVFVSWVHHRSPFKETGVCGGECENETKKNHLCFLLGKVFHCENFRLGLE